MRTHSMYVPSSPNQCSPELILLSRNAVIGVHAHDGTIGDKIGYRFHDIPGVFPPRQSSQEAKLNSHESKTNPSQSLENKWVEFNYGCLFVLEWRVGMTEEWVPLLTTYYKY